MHATLYTLDENFTLDCQFSMKKMACFLELTTMFWHCWCDCAFTHHSKK